MNIQVMPSESAYRTYINGIVRLHELTRAGLDESPEADQVRDAMDFPWSHLTEEERERINGLSEDLYSLTDPSEPILPQNPQSYRMFESAQLAARERRFDDALSILRRWHRYISPSELAFLRGFIWRQIGELVVAAHFFEHAVKLKPTEWGYRWAEMTTLSEVGDPRSICVAEAVIDDDSDLHPQLLLSAAAILLTPCRQWSGATKAAKVRRITLKLLKLRRILHSKVSQDRSFEIALSFIDFILGMSCVTAEHWKFGEYFYTRAVESAPGNVPLRTLLLIVRYRNMPERAIEGFQQIRELDRQLAAPHLFLAHFHLTHNQFRECLKDCERGLAIDLDPALQAILLEWRAICIVSLGLTVDAALSDLQEAMILDPTNQRIRNNAEFARQLSLAGSTAEGLEINSPWETPTLAGLLNIGIRQAQSNLQSQVLSCSPAA